MNTTIADQTPTLDAEQVVAARRAALTAIDAVVRPLLCRRLLGGPTWLPPVVELTRYDRLLAATPATGGHWTVAQRTPVLLMHRVDSYAVTLEFDQAQRPTRFVITGAGVTVSDSAEPAALDQALQQARARGPLTTWAPSFLPGISV